MSYISVSELAKRHRVSERTEGNYCATGTIDNYE